jgi:hypothetical protein
MRIGFLDDLRSPLDNCENLPESEVQQDSIFGRNTMKDLICKMSARTTLEFECL